MRGFPEYFSIWHIVRALRAPDRGLSRPCVPDPADPRDHLRCRSNAEPFFTFTQGMLALDPDAYSLRWYEEVLTDQRWTLAIRNSFVIGIAAAILATVLGTVAAVGLASPWMPFKRMINGPSPVADDRAADHHRGGAMFFFYTTFGLVGTFPGLIIAHAALGVPFVIITGDGDARRLRPFAVQRGPQPRRIAGQGVLGHR